MLLKRNNKRSGFTLVELVVVMVIIAILAAAGYLAYTQLVVNKAYVNRCTLQYEHLCTAARQWVVDHVDSTGHVPQEEFAALTIFGEDGLIQYIDNPDALSPDVHKMIDNPDGSKTIITDFSDLLVNPRDYDSHLTYTFTANISSNGSSSSSSSSSSTEP